MGLRHSDNFMPSLLKEIRDAAVDANVPLANVLRKCAVLGDQLDNDDLRDWALQELNGYTSEDGVPKYRKAGAGLFGHFAGPFGSGYKRIAIPVIGLPEQLRKNAETVVFREGVAGLESLLEGEGETLTAACPGDWLTLAQHKGRFSDDFVLYAAWWEISKSVVVGALDAIRNRVLEFCLRLGKESPDLMASETVSPTAADSAAATQIFNHVIIGSQIGNIASASPGAEQSAQISVIPGDMPSLVRALTDAGVPAADVNELKAEISQDRGPAAKEKCDNWLERAGRAVTDGTWSLVKGATVATLREYVLAFLGPG